MEASAHGAPKEIRPSISPISEYPFTPERLVLRARTTPLPEAMRRIPAQPTLSTRRELACYRLCKKQFEQGDGALCAVVDPSKGKQLRGGLFTPQRISCSL